MIVNVEGIPRVHVFVALDKSKLAEPLPDISPVYRPKSKAAPHSVSLWAGLFVELRQKLGSIIMQALVAGSHENGLSQLHSPTTEAGLTLLTLGREQHSTHLETEESQIVLRGQEQG